MYADDAEMVKRYIKWGVAAVVALILLWLVFASTVAIGTGEIGVLSRYGRVTGQELNEGLHLKNPIDKVTKYDVKVLKVEQKAAAASKDLQDVSGTLVVNYQLEGGRVSEIHRTVGPAFPATLIDPAIQEVFKASTAKYNATQLITDRQSIKNDTLNLLRERLSSYGIVVRDLSITNFEFSREFTKAIEDKQVAQQNAERAKFNLEAARTDAQAQEAQSRTLSPLFLQKQFLEKWDGKLPQYFGGDSIFNIPLR